MNQIENLIPDNEGNHLVIVLNFYDEIQKNNVFQIPSEFSKFDIVDISINKLFLDKPLHLRAFFKLCQWLIEQFNIYHNAVFSFICSTDHLLTHHQYINPEYYRWMLFESLYQRNKSNLLALGIESKSIVVGPDGYQTFARVFYRQKHSSIIHIIVDPLENKYPS